MYKFSSKENRQELLSELKIERSRRYADRIRVILLLDEGETYKNISKYLFLDDGTIANYKKRYRKGGLEGLIVDGRKTRRTKLNEFEELELADDVELNFFLSTKDVTFHVKNKFRALYSISLMNNFLHRLGFTFKKAKGVPGKAKKKDQEHFLNVL